MRSFLMFSCSKDTFFQKQSLTLQPQFINVTRANIFINIMAEYIDDERKEVEESSGIDFRMIWSIIVLNWYWFIISAVVCVGLAWAYLRYQHPVYQSSTKVLIKGDKGGGSRSSAASGMQLEQLGIITNTNGFDNELEIISSTAVATRAVKSLKLWPYCRG